MDEHRPPEPDSPGPIEPVAPPGDTPEHPPVRPGPLGGAGGRRGGTPAWLVAVTVVLVLIVAVLQRPELQSLAERVLQTAEEQEEVEVDPLSPPAANGLLRGLGPLYFALGRAAPEMGGEIVRTLEGFALTRADDVRVAVIAGELLGAEEALDRLDEVLLRMQEMEDPPVGVARDVELLRAVIEGGTLDDEQREFLAARHGWFGELALTYGLAESDPLREAAVGRAWTVLIFGVVLGLAFLVVFLTGLVLLVIGAVMLGTGRLRSAMPRGPAPGPEMLETFALFVGGFLALQFVVLAVGLVSGEERFVLGVALGLQWLLAAVVFWPLVRGVGWERFSSQMGWHRGRGVVKEVMCGAAGWVAGLPLLLLAGLIMQLLMSLWELLFGGDPAPPVVDHKIVQFAQEGGLLALIAVASLVVIWAPVVEETVFRGALMRHLRGRMGFVGGAALVALVFAVVHGYPALVLIPVMTLGFVFAALREWRGSLIAPMTAHFLQNSMAFSLLYFGSRVLG